MATVKCRSSITAYINTNMEFRKNVHRVPVVRAQPEQALQEGGEDGAEQQAAPARQEQLGASQGVPKSAMTHHEACKHENRAEVACVALNRVSDVPCACLLPL